MQVDVNGAASPLSVTRAEWFMGMVNAQTREAGKVVLSGQALGPRRSGLSSLEVVFPLSMLVSHRWNTMVGVLVKNQVPGKSESNDPAPWLDSGDRYVDLSTVMQFLVDRPGKTKKAYKQTSHTLVGQPRLDLTRRKLGCGAGSPRNDATQENSRRLHQTSHDSGTTQSGNPFDIPSQHSARPLLSSESRIFHAGFSISASAPTPK